MALTHDTGIREVGNLTPEQKQSIYDFLQGAVYCWCKNKKGDWFSLRDLMGGDNYDWNGTPLIELYNKHGNKNDEDEQIKAAGQDGGMLLKIVIINDNRLFDTQINEQNRQYKWIEQ
ncbi:MAG: hypothetical protein ABSG94_03420 [Brevinematales bacterium]|jgi:hypothetical protein